MNSELTLKWCWTRELDSIVESFSIEITFLSWERDHSKPNLSRGLEEVPMKLNDTIMTYDVAEALQDESGTFEITSPNGERYFLTRQPGDSISSLEWGGNEPNIQPFLVRKVAQPITTESRSKRSAA